MSRQCNAEIHRLAFLTTQSVQEIIALLNITSQLVIGFNCSGWAWAYQETFIHL